MRLTNKDRDTSEREQLTAFGAALGLDEQFVAAVAMRGPAAVVDRLRAVGDDGQQMRLVAMAQQLGTYLQRKQELGEPIGSGHIEEAIILLSRVHKIDPEEGLMLLGAAFETMQHTARRLALGTEGEEDGR